MATEFAFLPWARTPLVARAGAPPANGRRRIVSVGMQVVANGADQGAPATTKIELYDAGDVKGFDPGMIARFEPAPNARAVEPNYFPFVEFGDADLPWRYSLDVGTSLRVTPWLALVALRPEEFRFVPRVGAPFPVIEVLSPTISLPDLANAWAWAHVQVDLTAANASMATLAEVVRDNPGAHFSRLLCTRKLEAERSYHLFLVPVYESGRRRGTGDAGTAAAWNSFAWTAQTTTPLRLPYFADSFFSTSAAEDFESLVRRISPIDLDQVGAAQEALGATRIRGGEPGYYDGYLEPNLTFQPEGALRTPLADDRREAFVGDGLTPRLVTTLNASLATPVEVSLQASQAGEDPLLTLPAYGHHFRGTAAIAAPTTGDAWPGPNKWVNEVNLDRRYRLAAGAGARAVRKHQEEFMAQAWNQAGDIVAANRLLAQAAAADALSAVIEARHLAPLQPEIVMALSDPVMDSLTGLDRGKTFGASLRATGLPTGVSTIDERRVMAKRPQRTTLAGTAAVRGTTRRDVLGPGAQPLPGAQYGKATVPGNGTNRVMTRIAPRSAKERATLRTDWGYTVFPRMDRETSRLLLSGGSVKHYGGFQMQPITASQIAGALLSQLQDVPATRVTRAVGGFTAPVLGKMEPLYLGPRIPEAMYKYLIEENPDLLLPGIADLPNDSAGLLVENRRVIEAFLLGCCHEMNRELLWREFPGDLRATVFSRFWERAADPDDATADDIKPIATWTGPLGRNAPGARADNIVLVLRGELVRRYPGLVIALNRQTLQGGKWTGGAGTDVAPDFWGQMGTDAMYYGFPITEATLRQNQDEYFFVIYEPMGRYRFGLDVASHGTRAARRDLRKVPVAFPLLTSTLADRGRRVSGRVRDASAPAAAGSLGSWADLSWDHVTVAPSGYVDFSVAVHPTAGDTGQWSSTGHAASIASVTFQKPIRVVISALRMISDA